MGFPVPCPTLADPFPTVPAWASGQKDVPPLTMSVTSANSPSLCCCGHPKKHQHSTGTSAQQPTQSHSHQWLSLCTHPAKHAICTLCSVPARRPGLVSCHKLKHFCRTALIRKHSRHRPQPGTIVPPVVPAHHSTRLAPGSAARAAAASRRSRPSRRWRRLHKGQGP
jgi:hypothetical protein